VTDPKGIATGYTSNAFGELVAESGPDRGNIRYQRDAGGQVVSVRDAKGQLTSITRDALGRPTHIGWADGQSAAFSHDAAGAIERIHGRLRPAGQPCIRVAR
jgi:YD repeat-containing protein